MKSMFLALIVMFVMYVVASVMGIMAECKLEQKLVQTQEQLKQAKAENAELKHQNEILLKALDSVGAKIENNSAVWQDCFLNTWNRDLQTGEWSVVGSDPLKWKQNNGDYVAAAN